MRYAAGVLFALLVLPPREVTTTEYEVVVHRVEVEAERPPAESPIIDELVEFDVDEAERQGACLWYLLRYWELDITLDIVLIAGAWADLHGGPCTMMEGHDG